MSMCRCAYIVPDSYAKNINIDEKQDLILPDDANLWAQFDDLRPRFVHYVGDNPAIFDFIKRTQPVCLRWQPLSGLKAEVSRTWSSKPMRVHAAFRPCLRFTMPRI